MSKTLSEGGIRYELNYKGSFTNRKPKFILNHVLSYRDTYDKYGLPRDVMKTIGRDIETAKKYAQASRKGVTEVDEKLRLAYFRLLREYYTSEGPSNPGMSSIARYAPFIGYKNAKLVYADLKMLKQELENAENKPEFED